ncbi:MAG: hypothetical protein GX993_02555 [Bacteroidales bacterium]|nr:hypothetical protein [Bacteroidales bacterium]
MKTYKKAELIAKNLPTGSYVAGCPAQGHAGGNPGGAHICRACDRAV